MAPVFFTDIMDAFQNVNEDEEEEEYDMDDDEEEEDLFEVRQVKQPTPLIITHSHPLKSPHMYLLENKWVTCPLSQRWLQWWKKNGSHHFQPAINHGRHLFTRKGFPLQWISCQVLNMVSSHVRCQRERCGHQYHHRGHGIW